MRPIVLTFDASSDTAICSAQTTTGAGSLVINGSLKDLPATMVNVTRAKMTGGFQRPVMLTATGDDSGINFTITGKNYKNEAITETIAGPNAGTVSTTGVFMEVDSITVDAAVTSACKVGTGTTGESTLVQLDYHKNPFSVSVAGDLTSTGAINYTVKHTYDDIQTIASPTMFNCTATALVGATADAQGAYTAPVQAVKVSVNSSTAGAGRFTIIQAGLR